jgi:hypothetical protein
LAKATSEDHEALKAKKIVEVEAGKAALDGEEKLIDYREQSRAG